MDTLEILVIITRLRYYTDELETEVKKETPDTDRVRSIHASIYEQYMKMLGQIQAS